jgi:hypothetical protein
VSGEHYTPAALPPTKESLVSTEQVVEWTPQPVWTLCRKGKPLVLAENQTKFPQFSSPLFDVVDGQN